MAVYLVERYWPGATLSDVYRVRDLLRGLADGVVYVGGVFVPSDEVALFAFDAPSAADARDAVESAGLRCDRLVPATII